jgi:hypothetical protein
MFKQLKNLFKKRELSALDKVEKGWKTGDFHLFREGQKELENMKYDPEKIREAILNAQKDSK